MAERPNILFLMSDEHRADIAGFAGDDVVRTPTLDRLARDGVVFRNAYAPSPICIPGRQAMMAGKLPWSIGIRRFGEDLPPNYMTFSRRFAQYAYNTVACGKLHHVGVDQMQGWTRRIAPDADTMDRYIEGQVDSEFSRYKPAPGTGKWTNQKEIERAGVGRGVYQRFDEAATAAAIGHIEERFCNPYYDRTGSHRPLMLKLSLIQPHYPFMADEKKFNYYLNRVPIRIEERSDHPVLSKTQFGPPVQATSRDIRRATAAYYAMVETVDEHFGRILGTLEAVGQDIDDWIVIYTSDHGDMLGNHGIWEKTRFYEESVRVPLVIRWPRCFSGGRTVHENVSLCDLFATLCDLCDIPAPEGLDSRSMAGLVCGCSDGWDDEAVSQIGNHIMIKRGGLKYQQYSGDGPEVLFDLKRDPGETTNVAEEPSMAETIRRFRERAKALGAKL